MNKISYKVRTFVWIVLNCNWKCFRYFVAIPTLLEFKTEGFEKREVELQESERIVYEKRNREGNKEGCREGGRIGGWGRRERDFEIDAFLVESYVFCMSVDSADTAMVSDAGKWVRGVEFSRGRGTPAERWKCWGMGWVQYGTRKAMEPYRKIKREGNWRVGECRQSYSSSALQIGSVLLPECKSNAKFCVPLTEFEFETRKRTNGCDLSTSEGRVVVAVASTWFYVSVIFLSVSLPLLHRVCFFLFCIVSFFNMPGIC